MLYKVTFENEDEPEYFNAPGETMALFMAEHIAQQAGDTVCGIYKVQAVGQPCTRVY